MNASIVPAIFPRREWSGSGKPLAAAKRVPAIVIPNRQPVHACMAAVAGRPIDRPDADFYGPEKGTWFHKLEHR